MPICTELIEETGRPTVLIFARGDILDWLRQVRVLEVFNTINEVMT